MRIDRTGKIVDDFHVLGHSFAPIYFLDGPSPALFDAGFARLSRLYEQDIKDILGSHSPAYLFITHSHWDHVGAAGYFKNLWPELQIVGSRQAQEYRSAESLLQQWAQESCVMQKFAEAGSKKLFDSFSAWLTDNGHSTWSHKTFSDRLVREFREHGTQKKKTRIGAVFQNIRLKA